MSNCFITFSNENPTIIRNLSHCSLALVAYKKMYLTFSFNLDTYNISHCKGLARDDCVYSGQINTSIMKKWLDKTDPFKQK